MVGKWLFYLAHNSTLWCIFSSFIAFFCVELNWFLREKIYMLLGPCKLQWRRLSSIRWSREMFSLSIELLLVPQLKIEKQEKADGSLSLLYNGKSMLLLPQTILLWDFGCAIRNINWNFLASATWNKCCYLDELNY